MLIDAENISHSFLEDISENIALYGVVSVRRIYGDWTSEKMKGWKALLLEYAIQPIQQFQQHDRQELDRQRAHYRRDGPSLHPAHRLLLHRLERQRLYAPRQSHSRTGQNTSVGIGEKKTPTSFVNACNEFIHIEPPGKERKEEQKSHEKQGRTEVLLEKAVDQLADASGWVMLSQLMQYIRQVKPDFDLRELGVRKPLDYFTSRKDKYRVQKERDDAPSAIFISKIR